MSSSIHHHFWPFLVRWFEDVTWCHVFSRWITIFCEVLVLHSSPWTSSPAPEGHFNGSTSKSTQVSPNPQIILFLIYPMISCNISVYIYTYCGCWNPHPQLEHCWSPGTIPAKENGSTGGTGWLDFWNLSVHVGSLLVWMKIESYLSYSVSWINPFHFYIHCVSPESSSKFEEPRNPQNEAEKYLRRSSSFRWCVPHNVQVMYFQLGVAVTVGHHQSSFVVWLWIAIPVVNCKHILTLH